MEKSNLHLLNTAKNWETPDNADFDEARIYVFTYFLNQLLHQIENKEHGLNLSFKVHIIDRLSSIKMSSANRTKIRARLLGKTLTTLDIDEICMRSIFQIFYEELCHLIGPVKTDIYCKSTLALTKELPEAALYNPQKLL